MVVFFSEQIPTIPDFFKDKNIFVTGGSGFIGKVLIEKLLRSCPDIGNIYILLREKRGKTLEERVKDMINIPLFDLLKKQDIDAVKKIVPINGDIYKLRLGLSDEDRNTIINQVNIIFNVAASVRFDDPLKKAILYNVRSTVELIQLAKDLKNLAVFVHVSTAYCNSDKKVIEEKLYPAHLDWRQAIKLAEEIDEHALEIFTPKFIKPLPNTYTFSKSLAEHVVNDLCKGKIPAVIFRPTIVISTMKEPIPSWIDNLNGPFIFSLATIMGLTRIAYVDPDQYADNVFVDNAAKSLIIAAWEKAVNREKSDEISIYNCSSEFRVLFDVYFTTAVDAMNAVPLEKKIWTPVGRRQTTKHYYYYFINMILFHMVPAIFLDGLLKLFGRAPIFIKIQRKLYIASIILSYFGSNSWEFKRENYLGLEDKLIQDDLEAFSFRLSTDLNSYEESYSVFKQVFWGTKQYLLNESPVISKRTKLIDKSLRILDKTLRWIAYGLMVYIVFWKYDMMTYLCEIVYNYFDLLRTNLTNTAI